MSAPRYRFRGPAGEPLAVTVDGKRMALSRGVSLLANLLARGMGPRLPDFHCAIGQCQRCLCRVNGRRRRACQVYLEGGEVIETAADARVAVDR